jgi:predicted GH43/DUF377 family glycosyl hydrolase
MEPEPGNARELEGVLNPAVVRGADRELYIFPRLTARGNYSRIGIARVRFDAAGDPTGVERIGIALEPEAEYELRPEGGGGCEDPRITFVAPLGRYVMTYTAFSKRGPRVALAQSKDLFHWERLGLATFSDYHGNDVGDLDNKDASLFPIAIPSPSGRLELAMIHRPHFASNPQQDSRQSAMDLGHDGIWISYCASDVTTGEAVRFGHFTSHHRLAAPLAAWERLRIGGGAPPVLTEHGWLIVYHGVSANTGVVTTIPQLSYSAGLMMLSHDHPRAIRYRSAEPVLTPLLPQERSGTIANVVFPSGIDRRDDLGSADCFDIYYGMADSRIGVARLQVPKLLPRNEQAGPSSSAPSFELKEHLIERRLRGKLVDPMERCRTSTGPAT